MRKTIYLLGLLLVAACSSQSATVSDQREVTWDTIEYPHVGPLGGLEVLN